MSYNNLKENLEGTLKKFQALTKENPKNADIYHRIVSEIKFLKEELEDDCTLKAKRLAQIIKDAEEMERAVRVEEFKAEIDKKSMNGLI